MPDSNRTSVDKPCIPGDIAVFGGVKRSYTELHRVTQRFHRDTQSLALVFKNSRFLPLVGMVLGGLRDFTFSFELKVRDKHLYS